MENILFRILNNTEVWDDGFKYPGLRRCGYGFNQIAFTPMAKGYKDAAEQLADSQCDYSEKYNEELLYPIMFCYRQSVELMLKAILLNLYLHKDSSLNTSERKELAKRIKTHKLSTILCVIEDSLKKIHCISCDELIAKINIYISAIEEVDSESFAMRYPANKELYADKYHKSIHGFDIQYTKEQFPVFWQHLQELYLNTERMWAEKVFI